MNYFKFVIFSINFFIILINGLENNYYLTDIDHFRPQNDTATVFHYLSNLEFYEIDGPFFIYIHDGGNENTIKLLSSGLIYELAQEMNGAIFTSDHRFFRLNQARSSLSFEDMTYLTIDQSLDDIAYLINNIQRYLNNTASKVILFGSGYGATLATWARQKFPHLVDGVWSSSGIFSSVDEFTSEPYERLSSIIDNIGGEICRQRTMESFIDMEDYIKNGQGDELQELLRLCYPVNTTSAQDIAMFYEGQIDLIINFLNRHHDAAIPVYCAFMEMTVLSPLQSFQLWLEGLVHTNLCYDLSYENRILLLSDEGWLQQGAISGARQWLYLKCTQFGLHKISEMGNTIFGSRITRQYHRQVCQDILGENFDFDKLQVNINRIFREYGGKNPGVSHIVFTNGLLDPWLTHGITEYYEHNAFVFNITDHAKSADMFDELPPNQELQNVRIIISGILKEWASPDIIPNLE